MSMLDAFFGHDHSMTLHDNMGDAHIHYHPDGMGGHKLIDDSGNILGHQNHDALGNLHTYDAHGMHVGQAHTDAVGNTILQDAHGMHAGTLSHGPLGDLFLDGVHLGQMGHDLIHGNPQFSLDPLTDLSHFQFPHFSF